MLIKNALVFVGKEFIKTDIEFNKMITSIGSTDKDADIDGSGMYIIPGLIDIHTHGAVGYDFSDGDTEAISHISRFYAKNGVTSFLATTMTLSEELLTKAVKAIRSHSNSSGAKCAGIHLEGPFINSKKCGAQNAKYIMSPDLEMFERICCESGGLVKIITLACELEGALEFIKEASKKCVVSLGHTNADYETSVSAYNSGATHATHLYNAMPPFLHREPGVIGAAFDRSNSAEIICDGLHIHPSVIRSAFDVLKDRLCLISDSLRCAGMTDGVYELGGQEIELKNGKAVIRGTDTLAGSTITVFDALKNAVKFGVPLEKAVYAATTAPAKAARIDNLGELKVGNCADLLILDKDLNLISVYIDGEKIS